MAQKITISKGTKGGMVRKLWNKARLKPSRGSSKTCSTMFNVKGLRWLFQSPILSWAVSAPWLYFSPQQPSHSSGTSSILGSPSQYRLHFHSFMQGPSCHPPDDLMFVTFQWMILQSLYYCIIPDPKPGSWRKLSNSALGLGWNFAPSRNYICIHLDLLMFCCV